MKTVNGGWIKQISTSWYILLSTALASFMIAKESVAQLESYWPLFFIWLVAVLLCVVWALYRYFPKGNVLKEVGSWVSANRWEILGIVLLTVIAFFVRFIDVESLPSPSLDGDESGFAIQGLQINEGIYKNMFASGLQGHPMLYFFSLAGFLKLFDIPLATRLASVLMGTLTIPLFYLFLRLLWGRLIASAGAIYMAFYHFHNHYSRVGMNNVGDPFILLLCSYFAWLALQKGRESDFILMGLALGFVPYFYAGARLTPIVIVLFILYMLARNPVLIKKHAAHFVLAILACATVALPLGMYWLEHPNEFGTRFHTESIFNKSEFKDSMEKTPVGTLLNLAKEPFLLYGFSTEHAVHHYNAPIPLVDRYSLVPFLIGFGAVLVFFWQPRNFLILLIFFASVLLGGAMVPPPSSYRLMSSIVAVCVFVAVGLYTMGRLIPVKRKWVLPAFVIVVIILLAAYNAWFYFKVYSAGDYYSDGNTRIAEFVGKHAQTLSKDTRLFFFGHPLMYLGHPALLIRVRDYEHFDVKDGEIYPSTPNGSSPRVFVFYPNWRMDEMTSIQIDCPGGLLRSVNDAKGRLMFTSYEFKDTTNCLPKFKK